MTGASFEIEYMYRDAGNYKFRASIFVDEFLSIDEIRAFLIDGIYFLPEAVGLDSLVPYPRNDDDHDFHELVDSRISAGEVISYKKSELIDSFRIAHEREWTYGK